MRAEFWSYRDKLISAGMVCWELSAIIVLDDTNNVRIMAFAYLSMKQNTRIDKKIVKLAFISYDFSCFLF